jgi:hypothetical protein
VNAAFGMSYRNWAYPIGFTGGGKLLCNVLYEKTGKKAIDGIILRRQFYGISY